MTSVNQALSVAPSTPGRSRRKLWKWAAGGLLGYAVLGFLILPVIVRWVAVRQLRQQLDREVTIRQVRINPFVLSLAVRGLLVKDKDGQDFLSWQEFYVNFQLSSFFGKAWVFKEIRLVQPFARARINQDYSLNFSDLVKKFSATASNPPAPPSKPVFLAVDKLSISNATADFTDLTMRKPLHRRFGPLRLSLTGLRTDPNKKNPYSFSGTTDAGEKFAWSGYFSLDPLHSGGQLSFEGVVLSKNAPLLENLFQFELKDGIVGLRADYEVALGGTNFSAAVTNAAFSLESLRLGAPGQSNNFFELDSFKVGGVNANTATRTATIGEVNVAGARLAVSRGHDAQINLVQMSHPAEPTTNVPGGLLVMLRAATNAFAALRGSTNLWSATLERLQVTNCAVNLEDLANPRPVRLTVDNIAVTAGHLSNVPGSNETAAVWLRWNSNGTAHLDATVGIAPPVVDVSLAVEGIGLAPLDPYLEPFLDLNLIDGKLNLHQQVSMRIATNGLPEIRLSGDAGLEDFAIVSKSENLVKWKSFRVSGLSASLPPPVVEVKEVALVDFDASIALESNRTLNVMNVLRPGPTNASSAGSAGTALPGGVQQQVRAAEAPAKSQGLGKQLGGMLTKLLESQNGTNGSALPKFNVDTVLISNAAVRFQDRSFEPPVVDSLDHFSGTITGISSEELRRADARLAGKIGGTGPIEITGKLNPLQSHAPTEMEVTLREVDLTAASPYTGKFAGYRLERGKLNLQLKYAVAQGQLKANNALMLDQFTFGSKVQSPDATKLPVRLAVALLKDRQGKIELELPVEGNLDDPNFRYGKAIMHVLVNVITKIITSPFTALGSLFGGANAEEVSYQDFAPGSAELTAANLRKLDVLLHGLEERPGLQLEIEGCVEPPADREGLRKRKLEAAMHQDKWSSLRKAEQARVRPEDVVLLPEDRQAYLQKVWSAIIRTNAAASSGPSRKASMAAKRVSAGPLDRRSVGLMENGQGSAPVSELEQNVLATISVNEEELAKLAAERARSVQQKLIESGKLAADRIIVPDDVAPNPTNSAARVYFHLR